MTQTLETDSSPPTTHPDFSGRAWFFQKLEGWLAQETPAPWLFIAEPGWGKSALARQIVKRFSGTLLWNGPHADSRVAQQNWGSEELRNARLIVVDGLQMGSAPQEFQDWLTVQNFACPVLVFARAGRSFARAQAGGIRLSHEDPSSAHNLADLSEFLQRFHPALAQHSLARSYGNFLLASMLSRFPMESGGGLDSKAEAEIVEVLWHLITGVVGEAPADSQSDLYKMLCLLAEAGEPLDTEQFVDFLGLSAARTQLLLTYLWPLLRRRKGHQLFNPWVARTISLELLRDMEGTHASVIAFFRETYPSWDEMSDPYGWQHLGHHCDRYARTGKKRDFSILHWLTEGPYIRIKLLKTRALVSTLEDVRRGLEGALEERDLPRIVSYGFMLPRMRREMAASFLHELADKGELERAAPNVNLLVHESSRYLANLLLAWQAADEGQTEWAERYLNAALFTPLPELEHDDLLLVTCVCASLLKTLPHKQESILRLLDLEENSLRSARNYLHLALVDSLDLQLRKQAYQTGSSRTRLLQASDQHKLSLFAERSLEFADRLSFQPGRKPAGEPLEDEAFIASITSLSKQKNESAIVDGLVALVEQALSIFPRPGWLHARLPLAVQLLGQVKAIPELSRGISMLSRLLLHLGGEDASLEVLESLASLAREIEDPGSRCRAQAEVGVAFHRMGQFVRSNQLISQSAALAFEQEAALKASLLKFIAGAAGMAGSHARARDLAYNALEVLEGGSPYFEIHCRGSLKQGVLANISNDRSLEMLKFYAENCLLHEMDPKVKALSLAAVAEGAHRLHQAEEARQWIEIAVGLARSTEGAMERSYLLARLAASEHFLGDRARYERLLQESMEALLSESAALKRSEGLMTLAEVRHHARDPRSHAVERTLMKELLALEPSDLLHSRTLLRVVSAKQRGDFSGDIQALLEAARVALEQAGPSERDAALLQHIRLELALHNGERAVALATQIQSTRRKAAALADIAEALIVDHPQVALYWLSEIPLRQERLAAILRCGNCLAGELRPSRQKGLLYTLARLTILATEDEAIVDVLLSRWIQLTTDPRLLERTARKMAWIADDPQSPPPLTLRQFS